eukprot:gb/GEZN01002284.1/.p1 GENE.gb/GEZN01002284.1/~~gb/GEZN01002284.1/.p1  ORF type:complete len:682 (+),score=109.28 gb/GEZN01002284.1/:31-2076(+)
MSAEKCINTLRILSAEIVQKANSGHPGMPIGMSPVAFVLWTKVMNYSPSNAKWPARDRFVLSNGHGCALLYSLLHLTGFKLSLSDLQSFRQLGSLTPGHPEAHMTDGVEVSTGPLGQGLSNAVGMAIAERHLAVTFNRPGYDIVDNYTYVFCGDGCLQEGITSEASSLAGHLKLGKLIVIYDDNSITIDGKTSLAFTENVAQRYAAYGWQTITVVDGNSDLQGIEAAIALAKRTTNQPTIISLKTVIGFGAENEGTHDIHGTPLGDKGVAFLKKKFGFNPQQHFYIAPDVAAVFQKKKSEGEDKERKWMAKFAEYAVKFPTEAAEFKRRMEGKLPSDWKSKLPNYAGAKPDATRNISGTILNAIADNVPDLMGGSADLTPSNKTQLKNTKDFQAATPEGRYIRFGVREHAMCAIGNGLSAYGGIIPFTATFLNFIEYAFGAVRISALSHHQQIFVMTHDSISMGEDGPTHQPIEAIPLCRATPNMTLFRPCDGTETVGSYICAMENKKGPSVICCSRQNLPQLPGTSVDGVVKGGYVLNEAKDFNLVLVATGSEVELAVNVAKILQGSGLKARVVSMPCVENFDKQSQSYKRQVLPLGVLVVSLEAAATQGWERFSHFQIGMRSFGASAPCDIVLAHFGFSPEKASSKILSFVKESNELFGNTGIASGCAPPLPVHFNSSL